jgi:hypothetical protein
MRREDEAAVTLRRKANSDPRCEIFGKLRTSSLGTAEANHVGRIRIDVLLRDTRMPWLDAALRRAISAPARRPIRSVQLPLIPT